MNSRKRELLIPFEHFRECTGPELLFICSIFPLRSMHLEGFMLSTRSCATIVLLRGLQCPIPSSRLSPSDDTCTDTRLIPSNDGPVMRPLTGFAQLSIIRQLQFAAFCEWCSEGREADQSERRTDKAENAVELPTQTAMHAPRR